MRTFSAPASITIVLTGLVVGLLPGLTTASAVAEAGRASISLQTESGVVAVGTKVKLSGIAKGVGRGATVTIWQMGVTRRWGVEGTTRTKGGGTYRYSEVVHRGNRSYKACVSAGRRRVCSKTRFVKLVQPRRYSVDANASAASYTAGQQVVVRGVVKPRATGAPLRLVAAPYGTDQAFATVARGKVGRGGGFTLSALAVGGDWVYRVIKPKTSIGRTAKSNLMRVRVSKAAVGLSVAGVSPATLEAGQPVTVTGAATTNLAGQTVYLQAYDGATSKWGSIGSAVVTPAGGWTITAPLLQAGKAIQLQVVAPETASTAPAGIAAGVVSVYGWYYLYDNGPLDEVAGGWYSGAYPVNGTTYAKSVSLGRYSAGDTDFGEANLGRSCLRFAASIGLADDSNTTVRYSASVKADSVTVFTRANIALGQTVPVDLSVANGLRLRLEVTKTSGDYGYDDLVFGDARLLCAF